MFSKMEVQLGVAASSLLLLLAIGTIVYRGLEDWPWIQSFYFSVATLATVGYGDLHPTSDASRLFTAFHILGGVAIAASSLGVIGTSYLRRREGRIARRKEESGD